MYSYFQAVFNFQNTKLDKFNFKLIIMKNLSVILFLMCVPFLISCGGSDDDIGPNPIKGKVTTEDLIDMYTGEKRGSSELTRSAGQISFKVETSNLIPGHVYQIVCSIFNKPENCTGPCDFNDNQLNVEVVGFVIAGKTVNSTSATFEGTLEENDINTYNFNSTTSNGWGGLQNALTATIRLDVRSQGPAQNSLIAAQTNNWGGGCSYSNWLPTDSGSRVPEEIGECAFIQLSSHVAP